MAMEFKNDPVVQFSGPSVPVVSEIEALEVLLIQEFVEGKRRYWFVLKIVDVQTS